MRVVAVGTEQSGPFVGIVGLARAARERGIGIVAMTPFTVRNRESRPPPQAFVENHVPSALAVTVAVNVRAGPGSRAVLSGFGSRIIDKTVRMRCHSAYGAVVADRFRMTLCASPRIAERGVCRRADMG